MRRLPPHGAQVFFDSLGETDAVHAYMIAYALVPSKAPGAT